MRADSRFFSKQIFEHLENPERPIPYIIAARLHRTLQRMLARHLQWQALDDGIDVASIDYESPGWGKARRMVMVRQLITHRPKATGKILKLFADDAESQHYRYGCFVTSLDLPAELVWKIYRMRADAKNRIKELKYDFWAHSFNIKNFSATEATMNFAMMAYTLMSLFRQAILGSKVQPTLKTLRYKVFAIGGYLTKNGNARVLKLSLAMRRQQWFTGLWDKSRAFALPAIFPSHL